MTSAGLANEGQLSLFYGLIRLIAMIAKNVVGWGVGQRHVASLKLSYLKQFYSKRKPCGG